VKVMEPSVGKKPGHQKEARVLHERGPQKNQDGDSEASLHNGSPVNQNYSTRTIRESPAKESARVRDDYREAGEGFFFDGVVRFVDVIGVAVDGKVQRLA